MYVESGCGCVFFCLEGKERSWRSEKAVNGVGWDVGLCGGVILVLVGLCRVICEIRYGLCVGDICWTCGGVGVSIWGVAGALGCI